MPAARPDMPAQLKACLMHGKHKISVSLCAIRTFTLELKVEKKCVTQLSRTPPLQPLLPLYEFRLRTPMINL